MLTVKQYTDRLHKEGAHQLGEPYVQYSVDGKTEKIKVFLTQQKHGVHTTLCETTLVPDSRKTNPVLTIFWGEQNTNFTLKQFTQKFGERFVLDTPNDKKKKQWGSPTSFVQQICTQILVQEGQQLTKTKNIPETVTENNQKLLNHITEHNMLNPPQNLWVIEKVLFLSKVTTLNCTELTTLLETPYSWLLKTLPIHPEYVAFSTPVNDEQLLAENIGRAIKFV